MDASGLDCEAYSSSSGILIASVHTVQPRIRAYIIKMT